MYVSILYSKKLFDKSIEIILDTNYIPFLIYVFESMPIHTIFITFMPFDLKSLYYILYDG